jgi:Leucine-rich repeat (LRR) protein
VKRLVTVVTAVALIAGLVGCGGSTPAGEAVTFPDPNLEAAVREVLNKPQGDIYASELARLRGLHAGGRDIQDLTGLEYCTKLENVNLPYNQISDLSPLANLTSLLALNLAENQIRDLFPLADLTKLQALALTQNQIDSIAPVVNLTSLSRLYLYSNQISDVSPLANLTNLTSVGITTNQISDILPLVQNEGLGTGDSVYLADNPLNSDSINIYIPELEARGVTVQYQDSSRCR